MGPVSNIYSVSIPADLSALEAGVSTHGVKKITDHLRWRDIDPDVSRTGLVVFASNREEGVGIDLSRSDESFDIFVRESGKVQAITDTEEDEMMPKFSPDAEQLAFVRERRSLVVVNMATRKEHVVYQSQEVLDFSWSPDGESIAVAERNRTQGRIVMVDRAAEAMEKNTGHRVLVRFDRFPKSVDDTRKNYCAKCGSAVALSWSHQGNYLAYVFHPDFSGERELQIVGLDDLGVMTLSLDGQQVQDIPSWSPDGESILYSALVDFQFQYDETEHRKEYRGSLQIFRTNIDGEHLLVAGSEGAARAPVFLDTDRFAYLKSDSLSARQYALVVRDFTQASESVVFDRVARNAKLVVSP